MRGTLRLAYFSRYPSKRHLSPVQESSVVGAKGLPTIFKEQLNRLILKIKLCSGEYYRLEIQTLNLTYLRLQNVFAFVAPDLESALNCWIRYKKTILFCFALLLVSVSVVEP